MYRMDRIFHPHPNLPPSRGKGLDIGCRILVPDGRGVRHVHHAALDFHDVAVLRQKALGDEMRRLHGLEVLAAGEDVHGGVGVFGPGVDADMRLGDADDAGYSDRRELVEHFADDGRARLFGSC